MLFHICFGGEDAEEAAAANTPHLLESVGDGDCDDSSDGSSSVQQESSTNRELQLPTAAGGQEEEEEEETSSTKKKKKTTAVLLEIVGAVGLSCENNHPPSTFCTVTKINNDKKTQLLHTTSVIHQDTSPIWTVATKSLCLLSDLQSNDVITVTLKRKSNNTLQLTSPEVGIVTLSYEDLITKGTGNRMEYPLGNNNSTATTVLALRFRPATKGDLEYFNRSSSSSKKPLLLAAADSTALLSSKTKQPKPTKLPETTTSTTTSTSTTGSSSNKGEKKIRVQPGPDPDNPTATKFMTKQQIQETALLPSTHWSNVGYGTYGSVFLEVIGCERLPNMDLASLTDAFVSLLFEDSYVQTPVIHNSLGPKWMPWSGRAFQFQIAHPTSILFLGILDYDELTIQPHDPISKIEIYPSDYEADTVYHLTYPLYLANNNNNNTNEITTTPPNSNNNNKATIQLRLRVHWNNPLKTVSALSFGQPPRFFVNSHTEKEWSTIRYLTRGAEYDEQNSMNCMKLYVKELVGNHWRHTCLLLDILFEILLWRGTYSFQIPVVPSFLFMKKEDEEKKKKKMVSIWFPQHSIILFGFLTLGMEYPELLPALIPASIAYGLLCNNHYYSTHPSPWHRVRSFRRFTTSSSSSSSTRRPGVSIEPGTGSAEAQRLELLDEYRMNRTTGFLYECCMIALRIYKVYNTSLPIDISTVKSNETILTSFYSNYLSYAISLLRVLCKQCRSVRNFVNWKSQSTYKMTLSMLIFAVGWIVFPFKSYVFFTVKVLVWLCVGPHLKLVDVLWIQKYYRTSEQLLNELTIPTTEEEQKQDIAKRPNIFDALPESSSVSKLSKKGRLTSEQSCKLRDYRKSVFGSFSEHVHYRPNYINASCVPLSEQSWAQPYNNNNKGPGDDDDDDTATIYKDLPNDKLTWSYIPGQMLEGDMIPQPVVVVVDDDHPAAVSSGGTVVVLSPSKKND